MSGKKQHMPTYGKDKERDMIRSVLPSSRRKSARDDLARIKRNSRREIRQALHNITIDPDLWDETPEVYDYPDIEIQEAMWDRREGDKLGPLLRWAPTKVDHLRIEDRLSAFTAMLPDNTIGRHAASHVDYLDEFYVERLSDWRYKYRSRPRPTKEERAFARACKFAALCERLEDLLHTPGMHGRLNRKLKGEYPVTNRTWIKEKRKWQETITYERGRPLYGVHDIEAFLCYYAAKHYRVERLRKSLEEVAPWVDTARHRTNGATPRSASTNGMGSGSATGNSK